MRILTILFILVSGIANAATLIVDQNTGAIMGGTTPALFKSGNGLGLVANPLSQFADTSSAQIAGVLNDETGFSSGALAVFSINPTFTIGITSPAINGNFMPTNTGAVVISTLGTNAPEVSSSVWMGANAIVAEGTTENAGETTISFQQGGSSIDRTFNLNIGATTTQAFAVSTLASNQEDNANSVWLASNSVVFEGATADANETSITITDPTADANITVPAKSAGTYFFMVQGGNIPWNHTDTGVDQITFFDDSSSAYVGLSLSGLTITGTTLAVDAATESGAGVFEQSTTAEAQAMTNNTTAMSPADVASALNYTLSVNLTADNQTITVGTARTILISSDSSTAANRTFDLDTAPAAGARLTLIWDDTGSNEAELSSLNVQMRTATHTFRENTDTLHFVSTGDYWSLCGMSRGEDLYSTDEIVVGQWIDGKTLYRKTINVGTLPNNTTSTDAHGISGGSFSGGSIKRIYGFATNGTQTFPIPNADATTTVNNISVKADGTNITVGTGVDFTAYSAHITVEFTK